MNKSIYFTILAMLVSSCLTKPSYCEDHASAPICMDAAVADGGTTDGATMDGGSDAAVDAAVDLGPPPCDGGGVRNDAGTCVECTSTANCTNDELCNTTTFECVECLTDAECDDPTKPVCGDTGECRGCTADTECSERVGAKVCDERNGQCRQCDPDESNDPSDSSGECGRQACDPATWTCGTTERGALNFCQTCTADSECKTTSEGIYRCVHITWTVDSGRTGNYCVLDKATTSGGVAEGACPRRAQVALADVASRSGTTSTYCGPRATVTTCEAIVAVAAGTDCSATCPTGTVCVGGGCRLLCTDGFDCASGQMCNDAASDYCN